MKKVRLTYFKDTGKYYTNSSYDTNQQHDFEVYSEVRRMIENRTLPGLSRGVGFRGMILVQPYLGVPQIVFNEE